MALPRVKVAKDKTDLIQKLLDNKSTTGVFQTYADIVIFAASFGLRHQKKIPLQEVSQTEPAPISLEIFLSRGYEWVINLIAIADSQDTEILATDNTQAEQQRITILEEYANGGLAQLQEELRGAVDYTERLLLIISAERFSINTTEEEFDLSRFL